MNILDTWASKGKSGGIGVRNYWPRSFYSTIGEINQYRVYHAKNKLKHGQNRGGKNVKKGFEKKDKEQ